VLRTSQQGSTAPKLLSICGPSGSGKTTICRALKGFYQVYIEDGQNNPHLHKLIEGSKDFDAAANQHWFLDRMEQFIDAAHDRQIVLDQDPAAIVLAYSRMFHEESIMTTTQCTSLMEDLLRIENKLQRWKCPRVVLCIDAPAEVLRARVVRRVGESLAPPLAWFARVRECFRDLWPRFPNVVSVPTVHLTPEQVIARARQLLEDLSDVERGQAS